MLDLYRGNICCSQCHHIINVQNDFQDHCPYCKKRLTKEEIEFWEKEAQARELRKRKFNGIPRLPGESLKDIDFEEDEEEEEEPTSGTPDPQTVYKDWVKRQQARQTQFAQEYTTFTPVIWFKPISVEELREQYPWMKKEEEDK